MTIFKTLSSVPFSSLRAATSGRLTPDLFQKNLAAFNTLEPDDDSYQAQAIRAQAMYHKDWLAYNEARHKMRLAWAEFFKEYDLLLCPTATTAAFPHNQKGERWDRMIMVNGKPQPSTRGGGGGYYPKKA